MPSAMVGMLPGRSGGSNFELLVGGYFYASHDAGSQPAWLQSRPPTFGMRAARRLIAGWGLLAGSVLLAGLGLLTGCSRTSVPDPASAAQAFLAHAAAGDAEQVRDALTDDARAGLSTDNVAATLRAQHAEHADRELAAGKPGSDGKAKAATTSQPAANVSAVQVHAELRFDDGESVELTREAGEFRIVHGGELPAAGPRPQQALAALRRALARRSYPAMLRVLTPETRRMMERDLAAIVVGLERPEGLEVKRSGDRASVALPDGHLVRLRQEFGLWRVESFE